MQILVKFLASYYAMTGLDQLSIDIPEGSSVNQLIKILSKKFEKVPLDRDETIVVLNDRIATRDQILKDGEKVLIFHLFSGG